MDVSILDLFQKGLQTVLRRQVSRSGMIDLPLLGERIRAAGLTKERLRREIAKAYRITKILKDPTVSVTIVPCPGEAYIMGSVPRPGVYSTTGRKLAALQLLAAAGFDPAARPPKRVQVLRKANGNWTMVKDLEVAGILAGRLSDLLLRPGDLVLVRDEPPKAAMAPPGTAEDPSLRALKQTQLNLTVQLENALNNFGPRHRMVESTKARLAVVQAEIAKVQKRIAERGAAAEAGAKKPRAAAPSAGKADVRLIELQALLAKLIELQLAEVRAKQSLARLTERERNGTLATSHEVVEFLGANRDLRALRERERQLPMEFDKARREHGPKHTKVREIEHAVAELRRQIKELTRTLIAALLDKRGAELAGIRAQVAALQKRIRELQGAAGGSK